MLHGFSTHIVPRPAGWRPGLEICGYWWPQTDPQWRPAAALVDFLRAGPPPVYVGFGRYITAARGQPPPAYAPGSPPSPYPAWAISPSGLGGCAISGSARIPCRSAP
ncbi:putative glycosyl transferase [Mycobacteroides abscessus subsp. abscessus]|nr:putative glycosyl transferase [Mycobacteroides abscessus subsp. abscessus]